MTVEEFVRRGPHEILAGHYIPNNHELFSMLAWATASVLGESEAVLRLPSVLPFIAGVALVTWWLHVRLGALSGLIFLFFATVSPLLLDITRQARGYGLAFAAMSVLVVCALELRDREDTRLVIGLCAAGVVGTCTLPNFGVAFIAIAAVLLTRPALRIRAVVAAAVSLAVIAAWYGPHIDDILEGSRQTYGVEVELAWLITAPIDQILIPALIWIDGVVLFPGVRWLPLVAAALLLLSASPLLRDRHSALVLASGPVATVLALWITGTYAVPRFLSYLLVPLFVLMASGIASIFMHLRSGRPQIVRTVVAFVSLGLVAAGFVATGLDVVRLPRGPQAGRGGDCVVGVRRRAGVRASAAPPDHGVLPRPTGHRGEGAGLATRRVRGLRAGRGRRATLGHPARRATLHGPSRSPALPIRAVHARQRDRRLAPARGD